MDEIRKKCKCVHGNALLCNKCKYNPSKFLKSVDMYEVKFND